jgi:hypothetical protein
MLSNVPSLMAHIDARQATAHHRSAIISHDSSAPMHRSSKAHDSTIGQLPKAPMSAVSTVPANGDVNPYGVAFVPSGFPTPTGGKLKAGDLLVSNFNNSSNLQGTGSTIVDISSGSQSVFFQDTTKSGLTTALGVLKNGFVIVGNLPTTYNADGSVASIGQGSLRILDPTGKVVRTLSDPKLLDGPWDLTVNDQGSTAQVFVSNVLNGVVTRIDLSIPTGGDPTVQGMTEIASGYPTRTDPAALVIGPTGLAFDAATGTLYVASTADNAIFSIANANTATAPPANGVGSIVYQNRGHLHGPLGLTFAPDGNLISAQGDAINPRKNQSSELVEITPTGKFVGQFSISKHNPGGAFGVASSTGSSPQFAAVNDINNTVEIWNVTA